MANVLVGCEFSGVVRRAFRKLGHNAWSCDLLLAQDRSKHHYVGDVRDFLNAQEWHLAIFHPPCTRLANSGVRWIENPPPGRTREDIWAELLEGIQLFTDLLEAPIPHIAVENPTMHGYARRRIGRLHSQAIHPWQFAQTTESADYVSKRTCLWLKALPKLVRTGTLDGKDARKDLHNLPRNRDRWKIRSTTFDGIADAMAAQWGPVAEATARSRAAD